MNGPAHITMNNMLYSCTASRHYGNQQFIGEHTLDFVIAGEISLQAQHGPQVLKAGSMVLLHRNQLIKSVKIPPANGEFQSVSIILDQAFLRQYCVNAGISNMERWTADPILLLRSDELLTGYFESILPYFKLHKPLIPAIAKLKTQEAVELLLNLNPQLGMFLFDFTEPSKIDLEVFMNQNFTYNVHSSQFARLTGRSLATFKRDFEKIFKMPPRLWLMNKRLKEAHYQIKEKGRKPSDVYLNVGFENLSHFSFAFKNAFGVAPSKV